MGEMRDPRSIGNHNADGNTPWNLTELGRRVSQGLIWLRIGAADGLMLTRQ